MASHLSVSLSDSIQASLIIQHQEQPRQRHSTDPTGRQTVQDDTVDRDGDSTKGLSLWVQCLLVMVFAGIEISAAFTVIYGVPYLQFVNVPTSLLSMPGTLCGSTTIILLPTIGWFASRGSNPVIRKMKMMLISLTTYITGYAILAICSASKLHSSKKGMYHENATNIDSQRSQTFPSVKGLTAINYDMLITNAPLVAMETAPNTTDFNHHTPDIISYFGIFSFALLDIGFDASSSLCRAFILECTPSAIHNRLLVMATVVSSVAGATFSLLGTTDFPGILAPMFNVDGTAATVMMFCFSITTVIICCFTCTVITGYVVAKSKRQVKKQIDYLDFESTDSVLQKVKPQPFNKSWWKRSNSKTTKDASTSTEPLLWYSKQDNRSYSSFSITYEEESTVEQKAYNIGLDKSQYQRVTSQWELDDQVIYENKPLEIKIKPENRDNDDESLISQSDSEKESVNDGEDEDGMSEEDQRVIPTIMAAIIASYSMSMSMVHSSLLGDFQKRKAKDTPIQNNENSVVGQSIWRSKRLRILCVSMFFAYGALVSFSIYNSNDVTVGIYHGIPTALPGTRGRELYEKGLRIAALGNLVLYLAYAALCILNRKIIDIIDEKSQFVACHILSAAVLVALVLVKTEELYYLSTAAFGFQRACAFTLGYILANKIVQEECPDTGDPNTLGRNMSQVMVLIGFLLPTTYLLSSVMIGPLLAATGSVWVPMIMGSVYSAISALVFCLLYIIKPSPT